MSSFDEDAFINMVNKHSDDKRNEKIESVSRAETQSVNCSPRRYYEKKRKNTNQVHKSIVTIVLAATVAFTAGSLITNHVINQENVVIAQTNESKDYVDERINYYQNAMGMYSNNDNRVENYEGRNFQNNEPNVSYNHKNLAKNIYNAALLSESEMRCVIIAAYNIINEPYREDVLSSAFNILESEYSLPNELKCYVSNGLEGFLNQLNYKDLNDYRMNERQNIKDLKTLEEYVSKGVGR